MNVCLMVHSKTGTTLKFGKQIAAALEKEGHTVAFIELMTDQPVSINVQGKPNTFHITNLPPENDFDLFLIGSPVWGGQPTPVALETVAQIKGLEGKKFLPFVTQGFPFSSLGGKQSLAKLSKYAKEKNALILEGVSIGRMFKNLDTEIEKGIRKILAILKQ